MPLHPAGELRRGGVRAIGCSSRARLLEEGCGPLCPSAPASPPGCKGRLHDGAAIQHDQGAARR
eukprot:136923-Lingulodinium_polyedra.AAC.1